MLLQEQLLQKDWTHNNKAVLWGFFMLIENAMLQQNQQAKLIQEFATRILTYVVFKYSLIARNQFQTWKTLANLSCPEFRPRLANFDQLISNKVILICDNIRKSLVFCIDQNIFECYYVANNNNDIRFLIILFNYINPWLLPKNVAKPNGKVTVLHQIRSFPLIDNNKSSTNQADDMVDSMLIMDSPWPKEPALTHCDTDRLKKLPKRLCPYSVLIRFYLLLCQVPGVLKEVQIVRKYHVLLFMCAPKAGG
jgi:hypothetical protein